MLKTISKKARLNLSKYDRYKLSTLEQKIYEFRKEYCDIFEALVLVECAKPVNEVARCHLHQRLKSCISRYNKVVIQYNALVFIIDKEQMGGCL